MPTIEFDDIIQLGTLLSILIAAIGLCLGVYVYRRQMNAQLFLEYTRRYEETMAAFPVDHRSSRFDLDGEPPDSCPELTTAVLRYLNLSSEEFYLCERCYLSKDIWRIWEAELKRTLRSPLLRREWKLLQLEFTSYDEFREYVERAQAESSSPNP